MGIAERKEREREEMRERILQGAQKVFLANGYEKTSIRTIADAIEYSPATIYLYYKDKNALLFALHEQAFLKMMGEFAVLSTIADPFDRLIEMGNLYINYAIKNPELYDLMFIMEAPMESLACRDELWEDGMKSFGLLKAIIGECMDAGYFKSTLDVEITALTVWSHVYGLVAIHLKKRMDMFEPGEQVERMFASFKQFTGMLKSL
jgi:AcrR family transcriptional regulator